MNLRNVKALGSLKQLTSVNLAFNSLESLSALHGLSCLTMVDCSHNKIASLEGLADSIQSLTQLRCSDNVISGLHRLNQCSQLTELWINKNSLSRVEELLHLRGLVSRVSSRLLAVDIAPTFVGESPQTRSLPKPILQEPGIH
jgi:Leucine-rich repeat (LRR) protein